MASLRIKVQFGDEATDQYQKSTDLLKFVYLIESSSNKTIGDLIRNLQKYIDEEYLNNNNTQIVRLTTHDGFILSKNDLCSAVLKDNDYIICIDMAKFAAEIYPTIDFDNLWLDLKQHDASDNQEKCINIGLNSLFKLFIRMRGTEDIFGTYVFTTKELITIANEKRKDNLIARLDNNKSSSIDWFVETKWEYDNVSNKDLFIICNLKVGSSDEIYSNKLHILLDQSRMQIQKGEVTVLSGDTHDGLTLTDQQRQRLKELASKIPPLKRTGPQIDTSVSQNLKITKHECEGESSIRMSYGNTNTVTTYQDLYSRDELTIRQYFVITHIIFSKKPSVLPEILNQKRTAPVDKPISVASLTIFYQVEDGSWRECHDIAIAPIAIRNEAPKWLTDSVINIEPDKLMSFSIKGNILTKGELGKDQQTRIRVHKSLPQPLKLKIVVTDNFGKQSSLIVEQLNKPVELITREIFLKNNQSSINELLAFTYADDCEFDERIYMVIYIDNKNSLVIRNTSSFSIIFGRKELRTMEFNARQNKTSEIVLDRIHYRYQGHENKATVLFDSETFMLYAIRLEISTKTSKTEEIVFIPIEKIQ